MRVLYLFKIKSAVFAYTTVSEINEKTLGPFLQTLGKKSSGVWSSEPEYTLSLSRGRLCHLQNAQTQFYNILQKGFRPRK